MPATKQLFLWENQTALLRQHIFTTIPFAFTAVSSQLCSLPANTASLSGPSPHTFCPPIPRRENGAESLDYHWHLPEGRSAGIACAYRRNLETASWHRQPPDQRGCILCVTDLQRRGASVFLHVAALHRNRTASYTESTSGSVIAVQ